MGTIMNTLIQHLVEQATSKEEFYPAGCNGYRYDFNKEKFAELLIEKFAYKVNFQLIINEIIKFVNSTFSGSKNSKDNTFWYWNSILQFRVL